MSHMMAAAVATVGPALGGSPDLLLLPPTLGAAAAPSNPSADHAWELLSLSLVAIVFHFLVVLHVRSTGPARDGLYEKRQRKRMAYAMAVRGRGGDAGAEPGADSDSDEEGDSDETLLPLLGDGKAAGRSLKERLGTLPDQYESFVSDAQARFDAARRMWGNRLEVMTRSLHQHAAHPAADDGPPLPPPPLRGAEPPNLLARALSDVTATANRLVPRPDAFKTVLQLFAYQDVWSDRRLDRAFATDRADAPGRGGDFAALSFYLPQLLSFLLHGAYLDGNRLEDWILDKCGRDLRFAHRCFWFLRSWCLGGSSGGEGEEDVSSLATVSLGDGAADAASAYPGGEEARAGAADPPGRFAGSPPKFSPEERRLIRQLLRRVVERGGRPATTAQSPACGLTPLCGFRAQVSLTVTRQAFAGYITDK